MAKFSKFLAGLALAGLALTGCASSAEDNPKIVVTTNILGDLVHEIVGDQVQILTLMGANADPHSFGISAKQAAQIEKAELVIYNGLGLEEGVLRNIESAKDAAIPTLEVGAVIDPIIYKEESGSSDFDPHFWTDPIRVKIAVEKISAEIAKTVDGIDLKQLKDSTANYLTKLDELDSWISAEFFKIPNDSKKLITNHHVFGYLAERYDFEIIGAIIPGGTSLASPSAADLKSLADALTLSGVRAIFSDSSSPDKLAQVLASTVGLEVKVVSLFSESLTNPGEGAASYLELMQTNTTRITESLTTD